MSVNTTGEDTRIVIDNLFKQTLLDPVELIGETLSIEREINEGLECLLKETAK